MVPVVLYKLNEREAIKMDPNSTKRPMAQRTMLAFIKKKRTDEENLLEMTAATNSNVESSMVSAASNIQSQTNVESLVDRKCLAKVHKMAYLSLYIFKMSGGGGGGGHAPTPPPPQGLVPSALDLPAIYY